MIDRQIENTTREVENLTAKIRRLHVVAGNDHDVGTLLDAADDLRSAARAKLAHVGEANRKRDAAIAGRGHPWLT